MNQTRLQSFIESFVQIFIGYFIAVGAQMIIFPYYDMEVTIAQNFKIGLFFMIISLTRMYIIRRWFNARLHKLSMRISEKIMREKNDY